MISLRTKIPGPKSSRILAGLKAKNGGWGVPHPLVFSGKGSGPYCEDIDGNVFLDFASQVATNPLGYNHPDLISVIKDYTDRFPIKFAGQDFCVEEHLDLLGSLLSISPKGMNSAFFVNSGAEAVENAIKVCLRKKPHAKFGISMESAFHGRTLGALSLTNSKTVAKKHYFRLPMFRLPYNETAGEHLNRLLAEEASSDEVGFVILEAVQGEGGYNIGRQKMIRDLRQITKEQGIPLICDEVQAGMGRTGKWWAYENFGIVPEIFPTAKALQVGAIVSKKSFFPGEPGAINTTWGGGHIVDMAIALQTIKIIKKHNLLAKNTRNGKYIVSRLKEIRGISNPRGLGLMCAFDVSSPTIRDNIVIECVKQGLIVLGCGKQTIRIVPPYICEKKDLDAGLSIIERAAKTCSKTNHKHTGHICNYMECGDNVC